ncbi:MAG: NAD(P)-dependent oxidoreductase [Planctomycetota bacterium]|nr:MAG: NAD(P)-dependent oxidoreductase [Planctomycetota bacterium]
MKVALTGATGLVGPLLVERLLARGQAVRALVRPRAGRTLAARAGVEWIEGRLDEAEPIARLCDGADAIVHAAFEHPGAIPVPGRSEAEHYVQTNFAGTMRLLERTSSLGARQLVYVSSYAVYGRDPNADPLQSRAPRDERYPLWPTEFYGAMRAAVEKLCFASSQAYGLNVSIFRLGLVLGRRSGFDETPCASSVLEALRHGELRERHGSYVLAAEDAAQILADAVGDASLRGEIYNAVDRWLDFRELAPLLTELIGRPIGVACAPAPAPRVPILCERIRARYRDWRTESALRALLARLVTEGRERLANEVR